MEAIILAGGLGTRLSSRLNGIPKPMAMVANRPFLEIILDRLVDAGFHRVLLSVGYRSSVISNHFGCRYRGVPLTYVTETTPSGTGGAIRQALTEVQENHAVVLNGDTYFEVDYCAMIELHKSSGAVVTMAVTPVEDMTRYGGMVLDGNRVKAFIEKGCGGSGWINAGAYVLAKDFPWPSNLASPFSLETDVLVPFLPKLKHSVFVSNGKFLDIGVPEDLDRAQTELDFRR